MDHLTLTEEGMGSAQPSTPSMTHHSNEETKLWVKIHAVSICENELNFTFFASCQDNVDLLGCY